MNTWAVYVDHARMLVDLCDEGPEPAGAVGSGWQPGYTEVEAVAVVKDHIARGYTHGSETAPRF